MVKHIAKIVLGEELYNIKDTEARSDLNNHASNTDIHVTAAEKEYWNSKVNPPSYSAPTAKQLTYTGEAQDLLNPGSSTSGSIQYSTDETNWSTTVPQATNAGTYTVYWKFAGSEMVYVDSTAINVTIAKANPTYTAPNAKTLTYNGNAQDLVNAGSSSDGTISYSSNNENWGSSIPTGTNAGDYTVYWKLTGDANHNDVASTAISVSIAKVTPTVTAPTAKSLTYNTQSQELLNAGSTNWGTLKYSDDGETYNITIPSAINAGIHTLYYKVEGDSNINDIAPVEISVTVAKVTPTVTAPIAKSGLTYNSTALDLVTAGSTNYGELQYSLDGTNYGTSVATGTNAGSYTIYYKVVGNSNVNDVAATSISVSIAKANRSASFVDANGHEWVEIAGMAWATKNVGASIETDFGNYYMYGKGATTYNSSDSKYTGTEDPLSLSVDTARQVMGGSWHIPTRTQIQLLLNNTTIEWKTKFNGTNVNGIKVISGSNYIFLPAAGNYYEGSKSNVGTDGGYWSSTPSPYDSGDAYFLGFISWNWGISDTLWRDVGYTIRGVLDSITELTLAIGDTYIPTVVISGSPTITLSSSNTSIATVSGMTVTAVGGGTTTITATIAGDSNYNSTSISYTLKVPYPNGIYAAYADGSMRTTENADSNAIGVAVITDNCSFIIDKTNDTNKAWDSQYSTNGIIAGCLATSNRDIAKTNYAGISNTNAIAAVASGGEAAKYCRSCSKTIAGKTVYGYLGAGGEWQTAYNNKTTVDSIMSTIGGTAMSGDYWSSILQEMYPNNAWLFKWSAEWAFLNTKNRDNYLVRPFYEIS